MYDMDGHKQVNPEELSLILYSVITPTTSLFYSTSSDNKGLKEDKKTNKITHVSKLTRQTVEKMVNEAFEYCDTNKDGLLSQKQFTTWVQQNPGALQLLETVFAKHIWSGWDDPEELIGTGGTPHHGASPSHQIQFSRDSDGGSDNGQSDGDHKSSPLLTDRQSLPLSAQQPAANIKLANRSSSKLHPMAMSPGIFVIDIHVQIIDNI